MAKFGRNRFVVSQCVQKIVRMHEQQQSPEVRHEAMTAQAIHRQAVLEFVVALFAGAATHVVVVTKLCVSVGSDPLVRHDESHVGSMSAGLSFGDDRARLVPRSGAVFEDAKQSLLLTTFFKLFDGASEEFSGFAHES